MPEYCLGGYSQSPVRMGEIVAISSCQVISNVVFPLRA